MTRLRAVFVSLTGALLEESGEYHALDAAFEAVRARYDIDDAAEALAGEYTVCVMDAYAAAAPRSPHSHRAMVGGAFRAMLASRGLDASGEDGEWFWNVLVRAHGEHGRAYAEVPGVLEALRERGLHVGVVTGTDAEFVEAATGGVDLGTPLDSLTTADEAGALDVAPRLFRLAVEKVPCRPREALAVGTAFERDVAAARSAGLHGALLDRHGARTVEGVLTLRSLRGLPELVDRLGALPARP